MEQIQGLKFDETDAENDAAIRAEFAKRDTDRETKGDTSRGDGGEWQRDRERDTRRHEGEWQWDREKDTNRRDGGDWQRDRDRPVKDRRDGGEQHWDRERDRDRPVKDRRDGGEKHWDRERDKERPVRDRRDGGEQASGDLRFKKSKLCTFFAQSGICTNGANCTFAHGEHELGMPSARHERGGAGRRGEGEQQRDRDRRDGGERHQGQKREWPRESSQSQRGTKLEPRPPSLPPPRPAKTQRLASPAIEGPSDTLACKQGVNTEEELESYLGGLAGFVKAMFQKKACMMYAKFESADMLDEALEMARGDGFEADVAKRNME